MNNNKCYSIEEINFSECLFPYIDATYVINLVGNGRLENVKKQIYEYKITHKNYILYNEGYKKCIKKLTEQLPRYDLIDAFYKIFEHANSKNYEHILILEDDFIINPKIRDPIARKEITNFLQKNKNIVDIYALGVLPNLTIPYYKNTNYNLSSTGTHAMIYSKKFIKKTLNVDPLTLYDWDLYTSLYATNFMYNKPLCFQLFVETENAKNWGSIMNIRFYDIMSPIFKISGVDKNTDGYSYFYNISKFFGTLLLLDILIILILIFYLFF